MRILRTAVAALSALALAGCGAAKQAEKEAREGGAHGGEGSLTVSLFGGNWSAAVQENIIAPFEAETGVTVQTVESTSTVALGKLRQDDDMFDVVLLDSGVSETAREEGLVGTLDEEPLTNLGSLDKRAKQRDDEGLWAVTMGFWALGLAYNTEEVPDPPESWEDLWDEQYAGKVSVPTPATTGGLPLLIQAAELNGGGVDKVQPGYSALADLDVAAFYDSSGSASNLMQSGEAVLAAHYNPGTWPMADEGLPISWVAPEEGALAAESRWHLTKGSSSDELAQQFIDFASSAKAQKGLAEDLYVAPANTSVELGDETAERMPYGPDGSLDDLTFTDWAAVNEHRAEWTDQWNRKIAQ